VLGRTDLTETESDASHAGPEVNVEYVYDAAGHTDTITVMYWFPSGGFVAWSEYLYDVEGRQLEIFSNNDGSLRRTTATWDCP
jgi:hypothetical protein